MRQKRSIFFQMLVSYIALLTFILSAAAVVIYCAVSDSMQKQLIQERVSALTKVETIISHDLSTLGEFVLKSRRERMYYREYQDELMSPFVDIRNELVWMTTSSHLVSQTVFFDGEMLFTGVDIYQGEQAQNMLKDLVGSHVWGQTDHMLFWQQDDGRAYLAMPLRFSAKMPLTHSACFVFQLSREYIDSLLSSVLQDPDAAWELRSGQTVVLQGGSAESLRQQEGLVETGSRHLLTLHCHISHNAFRDALKVMAFSIVLLSLAVFVIGLVLIAALMRHNYAPLRPVIKRVKQLAENDAGLSEYEMMNTVITTLETTNRSLQQNQNLMERERALLQLLSVGGDETLLARCSLPQAPCYLCAILTAEEKMDVQDLFESIKTPGIEQVDVIHMNAYYKILLVCGAKAACVQLQTAQLEEHGVQLAAGSIVDSAAQLTRSYHQAANALSMHHTQPSVDDSSAACSLPCPTVELEGLHNALLSHNTAHVQFCMQGLRRCLGGVGSDFEADAIFGMFAYTVQQAVTEMHLPVECDFPAPAAGEGPAHLSALLQCVEHTEAAILRALEELTQSAPRLRMPELLTSLERRFAEPDFSLKQLADEYGTSVSNLSHFFKSRMGVTLSSHVDALRIGRAKELLCTTGAPLDDIALKVGYTNASSFIRKFRMLEGVTPGEYRRQN